MKRLRDAIAAIVTDMSQVGRGFALIGGLAVSARSEPRTTRDVDLAVAVLSDDDAEEILRGITLPVAQLGHLIALKLLARNDVERPQDQIDLNALLAKATDADIDTARIAVQLIEKRGYQRGRDLQIALDQLRRPANMPLYLMVPVVGPFLAANEDFSKENPDFRQMLYASRKSWPRVRPRVLRDSDLGYR